MLEKYGTCVFELCVHTQNSALTRGLNQVSFPSTVGTLSRLSHYTTVTTLVSWQVGPNLLELPLSTLI